MTLTEQVKILNDKIKANKAQYHLDREAAKISALSLDELEKYEYSTGKDLGYKLNIVQKAKFEYSPLGKVFNKGLDKKEGLSKRLKNIESKNEQQLEEIKDQGERQLESINKSNLAGRPKKLKIGEVEDPKAKELTDKVNETVEENEDKKSLCTHSNGKEYNFYKFTDLKRSGSKIFSGKTSIKDAIKEQIKMEKLLMDFKKYDPVNKKERIQEMRLWKM